MKKIVLVSFEEQGRIGLSANFQLPQLPPFQRCQDCQGPLGCQDGQRVTTIRMTRAPALLHAVVKITLY